jgi:hypothetical protein
MASFAMLVSWKIWKEKNARVFRNQAITLTMLASKIKDEAMLWCLAGAKALCYISAARVGFLYLLLALP